MYILRSIAAYIKKQRKLRSDLVGIVDEFGKQLFYELNYVQEAKNCNRFKSLYGDIPGIYVPEAYLTYTSRRVLTMEFVEGVKGPWKTGHYAFLVHIYIYIPYIHTLFL
jgi:predicted unusual protein kinase regulating ubiquinone biosynthesis (AarF/ABC1/UbiB family)